jgi:leucyl/phenylalanyl-tRNA---protein transferase
MYWLPDDKILFPHPSLAEEDGLLAAGGDLSPSRVLFAYQKGIFPWYNEGEPILWWSPDPRMVLFPKALKISKSMRPYFNQSKFSVTYNQCFEQVIRTCSQQLRNGQSGTWIIEDMINAYCQLHELGFAQSVEVWQADRLVGGLYGIALGKCFFGESMFTNVPNASKFGFISFVQKLEQADFQLIDCQQETKHLASMGAAPISRTLFLAYLSKNETEAALNEHLLLLLK